MNLVPILSVIVIITISLLVTKIATYMLVNTGLSRYSARFQSRSAFTGVGFTTTESEQITTHPSRRKIISTLMLLGNAGIVTVMASLLLTFVHKSEKDLPWYYGMLVLVGSISILWMLASSNRVDRALNRVINLFLPRYTHFSFRDYSVLYKLANGFHLIDLHVRPDDWIVGKPISHDDLKQKGIKILGIEKPNGAYIGELSPDTMIEVNDLLIVYAKVEIIKEIEKIKTIGVQEVKHPQKHPDTDTSKQ